ncbi:MAG: hypothetical protein U5K79_03050 [Cyclobacteriaceae bacterium]|nr:hypothetical protein [Cyclobacteriaceae bacterium]
MSLRSIITMFAMIAGLIACSEENEDEQLVSINGSTESHKAGEACMNCHKSGGSGEGIFVVGGTIYNSGKTAVYPNATIRLYTGPNATGSLKSMIEVDGKGNFYTTESTDFGTGLYVAVEGNSGTNHMISMITNGNCNQCHDATSNRIWTE